MLKVFPYKKTYRAEWGVVIAQDRQEAINLLGDEGVDFVDWDTGNPEWEGKPKGVYPTETQD